MKLSREQVENILPLTPLQEGILFHHLMAPEAGHYLVRISLQMRGAIESSAFRAAWDEVVRRHAMLRTVFRWQELANPIQVVLKQGQLSIHLLDAADRQEIDALCRAPFDLESQTWRLVVIRNDEEDHELILLNHHIIYDGWSLGVLLKEFITAYEALSAGRVVKLPAHGDFQQYIARLKKSDRSQTQDYWKDYLGGFEGSRTLTLPAPAAPAASDIARYRASLPDTLKKSIEAFARQHDLTPAAFLYTAWGLLLQRYAYSDDVLFGTVVSGRAADPLSFQNSVGLFINTLPVRISSTADQDLLSLLRSVHNDIVAQGDHSNISLTEIANSAALPAGGELFDHLFVIENYPIDEALTGNAQLQLNDYSESTHYGLTASAFLNGEGIRLDFLYQPQRFDADTITALSEQYGYLLAAMLNGAAAVGELELVPPAERALLAHFNDTAVDYGADETVIDTFVREWPHFYSRCAVEIDGAELSYEDLDRYSTALAVWLRAQDLPQGSAVPIFFERGFEMIIAITAILKAGAAYVPIDPAYPQERIHYILSDIRSPLVLTQPHLAERLPGEGITVAALDGRGFPVGYQPLQNNASLSLPAANDLAYIIYTSGSTGQPKGVMIEHAGLFNRLLWMQQQYALSPGEGVLQKTTYCFDVSVWELLWPLLCGGRLVFARPGAQADGLYLRQVMDERRIAVVHFVPSMLDAFLSVITPGDCPSLRQVVCSGEALSSALADTCRQRLPQAKIDNLYGPTEASIDVSWWRLPEAWQPQQPVLIGWPVANTALHVLSSGGALTPIGGVGELYLEGVQLARGYWGKEALSSEKFIVPHNGPLQGRRLYRTGDLVRRHRDGALEYLGRMDAQVKVRGYRIEPGEIESCLRGVEGVSSAQVLATSGGSLQAYVQVEDRYPLLKKYIQLWRSGKALPSALRILPNGLPLLHSNAGEAEFLYREIFEQQGYLKHGIMLKPGACVVDVGANSGYFSVFVQLHSPDARVYSFEPVPQVFELLQANRYLYGIHGDAYALALSDRTGEVEISYYPQMTIVSGMGSDAGQVRDVVRSYMTGSGDTEGLESAAVEALLDMKLEQVSVTVATKRLSDVIRGENIGFIDVLKVDVENAEWLVLQGIDEEHWQQIGSVVVEVHDMDGRVAAVVKLLEDNGFSVAVEKEEVLSGDQLLYNVYAVRGAVLTKEAANGELDSWRAGWLPPEELVKRMREAVRAQLPAYMEPSSIVLIDQLPLTANGKLDRKALLALGEKASGDVALYVPPSGEREEQLVRVWEELLKVSPIGVEDNFFERGGHSLLAMRVVAAVRTTLGIEVPIRDLFAYPTIRALATRLTEKEGFLRLPPVVAGSQEGLLPLSYSQERLWFIDRLQGSRDYHIPAVVKLNGRVSVEALQWSLQQVINRHSVLRSVIVEREGEGYQQLLPENSWTLHYQQDLSKEDTEALIEQTINQPFDLSKDHPVRALLVSQSEDEHILVVVLHHIASDGWSMGILVREFTSLYTSRLQNNPVELLPLPVQYSDFARWQRTYVADDFLEGQLAYWKDQLQNPTVLELPQDRPVLQDQGSGSFVFDVPQDLLQRLQPFCQQQEVTLFMALLSLFKVLLYKYSGQDDICVGTPVAGRRQQEVENLIGFFVNTLVLRSHIDGEESFTSFLKKVKETTLEGYAHQDAPFEKVVEVVVRERDLGRNPLFQVMLVLQNNEELNLHAHSLGEDVTLHLQSSANQSTKFDLVYTVVPHEGSLRISTTYRADLFSERLMQQMATHFIQLLSSAMAMPTVAIGKLPMLSNDEEQHLLHQLQGTKRSYKGAATIVEGFVQQAAATPEAIALANGTQQLSYKELDLRSTRLAHKLIELGVKTGDRVAICLERSIELMVSVLAVLKTGAAYVPIDPDYPSERIHYMLEDAEVSLVLVSGVRKDLLANISLPVQTISAAESWIGASETPLPLPALSSVAYMIYTSGSTGKPNGVVVEHHSLQAHLNWFIHQYQISSSDSTLLLTSFSFDGCMTSIWPVLLRGGTLHLQSQPMEDPEAVVKYIRQHRITYIKTLPAILKALLHTEGFEKEDSLSSLRLVTVGGDRIDTDDVRTYIQRHPSVLMANQYGPTECTVAACFQLIDQNNIEVFCQRPTIGKAVDNTQLLVLDRQGEVCPVGVSGELYIGGVQVSRGYYNRPELTARKFVQIQGDRYYKTGDVCRLLADGILEYLGRNDDQVKIRGYRIELGEVERAVRNITGASQAAVVVRGEGVNRQLVAFVVKDEYTGITDTIVLLVDMRKELPSYMVPTSIIALEELPLTANGKIDRKALLIVAETEGSSAPSYSAPQTAQEQALVTIWQELLKVSPIGVEDNFFERGGHSLLAMRVIAAVRTNMGIEAMVRDLFTYPTIRSFINNKIQNNQPYLPPITAVSQEGLLPLSYSQERLWFIDRLQGSRDYHIPAVVQLNGPVSMEALQWSLQQVINRHSVLRSVIVEKQGEGYQQLLPENNWTLHYQQGLSKEETEALIEYTINQPFDLSKDHPVRALLISQSEDEHILVVVLHHIASDGWSMGILVREFVSLYTSRLQNNPVELRPLPVQYSDFARWQRTYVADDFLEGQLAYWKDQLQNPTVLELPQDRGRTGTPAASGGHYSFELPQELVESLNVFCRQQEVTLFMALLSLFKVLLYKYSGQDDICVGTPVAGRRQQEVENLIGFFVNTLVLRSHIDGEESFISFLKKVKETTLEGYAHQDAPFEKVVEAVVRERDLGRNPLFQVMLVLQNNEELNLHAHSLGEDVTLQLQSATNQSTKFDLVYTVVPHEGGLRISTAYRADLFSERLMQQMAAHFTQLLSSAIATPDAAIGKLPMLSNDEEQHLLHELQGTKRSYTGATTIVEGFVQQVAATPEAIALTSDKQQLTYKELDLRSASLAHRLRQRGVEAGQHIALCLERNTDMIVGMLGILRAGAAYVPIDPDYPSERIHYMLKDAKVSLVLTSQKAAGQLAGLDVPILTFSENEDWKDFSSEPLLLPDPLFVAYMIYTSGSTGKPNGVVVEHHSLQAHLNWFIHQYQISSSDSTLLLTSFSFDGCMTSIWPVLLRGGTLHLHPQPMEDPEAVVKYIHKNRITYIKTLPAILKALLHTEGFEKGDSLASLRLVTVGGDRIDTEDVRTYIQRYPSVLIANQYGPTECTVAACFQLIDQNNIEVFCHRPTIGRAVDNTQLLVLDRQGELCPIGVSGELYIGGVQVSQGYYNKPELTARKFVQIQREHYYKTGDVCRLLTNGNLEYLGRNDDQVKIRGYRIELGEVERAVRNITGASQAAVVVRGKGVNRQLVAFVVKDEYTGITDPTTLLEALRKELPSYMVPAAIISLEEMPLTANGKIDRKALLMIAEAEGSSAPSYSAPQTAQEQALVAIWEELLKVSLIGVEDNFFERGGHSLLAMRVIAAMRKTFNLEVEIRDLFSYPAIRPLLHYLKEQNDKASILPPVTIATREDTPTPLSYSQERLWFIDQLQGSRDYHIPAVVQLHGHLSVAALEWAFQEVIGRHSVLRSIIIENDGEGYQQLLPENSWSLKRQRVRDKVEARQLAQQFIRAPFDLSAEHPVRALLTELEEGSYLLTIVMHHIASDGWSMGILVRELTTLYSGRASGRPNILKPLQVQYSDFAVWQRKYITESFLEGQLAYWKNQLAQTEPLELPQDRPVLQDQGPGSFVFDVPQDAFQRLQQFCQQQEATLFMALLSLFKVVLYKYSGQDDICVGTPVAGRRQQEVENLIGFFVNTLVLRSHIDGEESFTSFLKKVKETTLEGYAHQDAPFEKVVEAVVRERDLSRNPLFQVMLVLQNNEELNLHAHSLGEDVTLEVESWAHQSTKFDLVYTVLPHEGGLRISTAYRADLFSEQLMQQMATHFTQLLSSAIATPDAAIGKLPMLSNDEEQQLLHELQGIRRSYTGAATIVEGFIQQAAATPKAVALASDKRQLTYEELDLHSTRFAHYLQSHQVGAGKRVALCLERSVELMVSVLAVLKTGAAYVPIDPNYPSERIHYMLEDAEVSLVVASKNSVDQLADVEVTVLTLAENEDWKDFSSEPLPLPDPSSVAYMIYTSGSTGKPNGVVVEHHSLQAHLNWFIHQYQISSSDSTLLLTSFSFDGCMTSIWPVLLRGGTLHLQPQPMENPEAVVKYISQHRITYIKTLPAILKALLHTEDFEKEDSLASLRLVTVGGDRIDTDDVRTYISRYPSVLMANQYGPTECTVAACFQLIDQNNIEAFCHRPTIGRAVDNTQLLVVDRQGELCPMGVSGELYIGGVQVSQGYYNKPELTARKFIEIQGERYYKTGDVCRLLADGAFEYLGRNDDQVKIRGYRIELGEVERAVRDITGATQAAVVVRGKGVNRQLVAFVVSDKDTIDTTTLLEALRKELPSYMVPTSIISLEELPLTANGKIDRKALLIVAEAEGSNTPSYTAPQTAQEQALVTIWEELLKASPIGVEDNFFERGGHSLLAMRLISAIHKQLGLRLSVATIFQFPTIRGLSQYIDTLFTHQDKDDNEGTSFEILEL